MYLDVSGGNLSEDLSIEDIKNEMAIEHFEYNILGAWLGEYTPIFIRK